LLPACGSSTSTTGPEDPPSRRRLAIAWSCTGSGTVGFAVTIHGIDPSTGMVDAGSIQASGGSNRSLAFAPGTTSPRMLYVGVSLNNGAPAIVPFAVDASGRVTPQSPRSAPEIPVDLAVHPSRRFLFALVAADGAFGQPLPPPSLATFALDSGMIPQLQTVTPLPLVSRGGIAISPSGRFLYVGDPASDVVIGFLVNPQTGALAPLAGSPFFHPRSFDLAFHPGGRALLSLERLRISGRRVDPETGSLNERFAAIPTNTGLLSDMALTDDGRFLVAADLVADALWRFRVDADGGMIPLGNEIPTADATRYVATADPYVYMTNQPGTFDVARPTSFLWGFSFVEGALTPLAGFPFRPDAQGCPGPLAVSD
jgi:6-phosphogluconolactonase (cycloisomerase 2 family)